MANAPTAGKCMLCNRMAVAQLARRPFSRMEAQGALLRLMEALAQRPPLGRVVRPVVTPRRLTVVVAATAEQ